jgi:hypothetical protein
MDRDSDKTTAAARSRQYYAGCEIQGKLLCIHTLKDLIDFCVLLMGWLVPFLAGMIIGGFWLGFAAWIGLAALVFGYVEALVLCRHCPHYAEKGFLLSSSLRRSFFRHGRGDNKEFIQSSSPPNITTLACP